MEHKRSVNWFWVYLAHEHSTDQDRQATATQASKRALPLCTTLPIASSFGMSMQAGHTTQLNYHWRNQEHMTMHMSRKPKTLHMMICPYWRHTGISRVTCSYHTAQRILSQHSTWRKTGATDNGRQKSYRIYVAIVTACCLTLPCPKTCKYGTP